VLNPQTILVCGYLGKQLPTLSISISR
jgi:hypothetical protein